jgi:hypothetical protein
MSPDLFTDDSGASRRLRVDVAKTGFVKGREFRAFFEFTTSAGNPVVLKFVSPIDFILQIQRMVIDDGAVRMEVFVNATPSGTWSDIGSIIGRNRMVSRPTPYYEGQCAITSGGTISGGTLVDVRVVRTSAQGVSTTTTMEDVNRERGLPAGEYYIKFSQLSGVNGTSTGIYYLDWEEIS